MEQRLGATAGLVFAIGAAHLLFLSGCSTSAEPVVRVIEITATPYVITATPAPSPTPIPATATPLGEAGIDYPVELTIMGFPFSVTFTRADVTGELMLTVLTGAPSVIEPNPGFKLLVLRGESEVGKGDADAGRSLGSWASVVDENGDAYRGGYVTHMRGRSEELLEWVWVYGVAEASTEFVLVIPGGPEVDLSSIVVAEE